MKLRFRGRVLVLEWRRVSKPCDVEGALTVIRGKKPKVVGVFEMTERREWELEQNAKQRVALNKIRPPGRKTDG